MREFNIYKFRTMQENQNISSDSTEQRNVSRLTGLGKILRPFHIDELPQLINILRGEIHCRT